MSRVITIDLATATDEEVEAAYRKLRNVREWRMSPAPLVSLMGHLWLVRENHLAREDLIAEGLMVREKSINLTPENKVVAERLLSGEGKAGHDTYRLPKSYKALVDATDRQTVSGGVVRFYRGGELVAVVTQCRADSDPTTDIHFPRPSEVAS